MIARPSTQPTAAPTSQPSKQPSAQPLLQPNLHRISQPTKMPYKITSITPSLSPLSVKFMRHPTSQPTTQPSKQPLQQSRKRSPPSAQPSLQPSKQPISAPSMQKFASQSLSPSVAPTLSLQETYTLKLNSILQSRKVDQFALELTYFDLYFSNRYLFGGCMSWLAYINNDLGLAQYDYEPQLINFTSVSSLSPVLAAKSVSCDERKAIANILSLTTTNSSGSVQCRNSTWTVRSCSEQSLAVCVDCNNPYQADNSGQSLSIALCQSQLSTGIAVFVVSYRTLLSPPVINSLEAVSTNTSIRITASLSSSGILNCGAFATVSTVISLNSVSQQNYNAATD